MYNLTAIGKMLSFSAFTAFLAVSASAESLPAATSYKAILNVQDLFHGNKECPSGWIPLADSGQGIDSLAGSFSFTEQFCVDPATGVFRGDFVISHGSDEYGGPFNGTFVPSAGAFEVHATWRITRGSGTFSGIRGAGTGKGVASDNGGVPGVGAVLLDGAVHLP